MHLPRPALALVLYLTACTTWAPTPLPAPDPGRVDEGPFRIVGSDSFARIGGYLTVDSQMVRFSREDGARDSIPRRYVARLEERKFSGGGTVVLVAGILALSLVLGAIMSESLDGIGSGVTY